MSEDLFGDISALYRAIADTAVKAAEKPMIELMVMLRPNTVLDVNGKFLTMIKVYTTSNFGEFIAGMTHVGGVLCDQIWIDRQYVTMVRQVETADLGDLDPTNIVRFHK